MTFQQGIEEFINFMTNIRETVMLYFNLDQKKHRLIYHNNYKENSFITK